MNSNCFPCSLSMVDGMGVSTPRPTVSILLLLLLCCARRTQSLLFSAKHLAMEGQSFCLAFPTLSNPFLVPHCLLFIFL